MVGLFDRPASGDCLNALRAKPVIEGLTDEIVSLDDSEWQRAVTRLREVRLLLPSDAAAPDALDAHPLVREWFGDRLKATNEKLGAPPTAGCSSTCATRPKKATRRRSKTSRRSTRPSATAAAPAAIRRRWTRFTGTASAGETPTATIEFYASKKLGALGSDLAAISWFFDKPYTTPVAALTPADQSWVLSMAAFALRAQGRFAEALPAMRIGLRRDEDAQDWRNAAIPASNLSEAELLAGEVAAAVATAERSVAHADRSGDEFQMIVSRATYADALHAAGRREEAVRAFADAERRQKKRQPDYPLLYSVRGYRYCDLLLAEGDHAAARDRASQTVQWARQQQLAARHRPRHANPRPRRSRAGAGARQHSPNVSSDATTRAPPAPVSTRPSTACAPPAQ